LPFDVDAVKKLGDCCDADKVQWRVKLMNDINILDFVGSIFRVRDSDISPELRGEFMMQWIPISEARRELAIQDAKEEGAGEKAFSVARTLLTRHIPINVIAEATGLNENDIIALR
jgi:hypothetical protein